MKSVGQRIVGASSRTSGISVIRSRKLSALMTYHHPRTSTGRMAEKLKHPEQWEQFYVRLKAPAGIRSVQTFSGRHLNIGSDGTVEMSAEDAKYLIPYGWIKLAEWSCDGVA
jgi:hypothetical protein